MVQQHELHKRDQYSREREVDGTGKVTPQRVRLGDVLPLRSLVRLKAVKIGLRL